MELSLSSCLKLAPQELIAIMEKSFSLLDQIIIITNNPNLDKEGLKILYVNAAFSRVTGYEPHEVLCKKPSILQGVDTSPDVITQIRNAIKNEVPFNGELLNYTKSGQEYWIELNLTPLSINGEQCQYYIGHSFETTRYKKTREIASEREASLDFVLESAGLGYWDLDLKTNETKRSLRHDNLFGHLTMQENWSYETFLSHIIEEDKRRVDQVFNEAMRIGGDYDVEFRCRWPDGSIHWLWSKGRFIANEHHEVIRAAGIQANIDEKKSAQEKIYSLAFTDELTQLPNRAAFNKGLKKLILNSKPSALNALLFIDLDDFKVVNDTSGHDIGDLLLGNIAKRLSNSLSNVNMIARFGGDEFLILAEDIGVTPETAYRNAENLGKKIRELFKQPFFCKNHEFYITSSIGITLFNDTASNKFELLKQADLALYYAKSCGKNRYSFFNESLQLDLVRRNQLETDMRKGLSRNEFFLVYQPKVNCNNQLVGAEALIRWRHPTQGIISPAEFIPLAEDTGLIVPMGEWVLTEAIKSIKSWSHLIIPSEFKLSINISPVQFNHERFVERFSFLLNEFNGLMDAAASLVLEITENTVIQNLDESMLKMTILKEFGVTFSLDDFGSGFSSLNYLKLLPINEIKIDKTFIDDIVEDRRNEVILEAIIKITQKLNLDLVIEGVESIAQVSLLNELGAKVYQGFYFSKPLSEIDFLSYAQSHR
ncbi:EAL domain-containing protein [Rheinheimera sp. UJ51]|uniref:putative bifunctional diguanylate cyclase/phosphodiesterase n=1 Tax=Rheinheimera sp. UJ51 TaxID=2892446 RepID=UPI001E547C88|nr:GGDEF domain-containing phosphodiesterase [Rheinheimera sp. UJ51]MCC5451075.1 EAL domain-containing protein [Rheinheimera sp. UJ51]